MRPPPESKDSALPGASSAGRSPPARAATVRARRLLLVIAAAMLIPIVPYLVIGELPGSRWLSGTDTHALRFGATAAVILAGDVVLPIPSSIVGTLAGARLGLGPGWLCVWLGLTAGNAIGYCAGRLLFGRMGAHAPAAPTLFVVLVSRPVPVLAEATTFVAGAAGTSWWSFLAACATGNAIYALALAANGAALVPQNVLGPGLILPFSVPVAAWLLWRWLGRRTSRRENRLS